jgi:hypothetical protein
MGFFKNIGKSLKNVTKAISLKNGLKAISGDYVGIGREVAGRAIKGLMGKDSGTKVTNAKELVKMQKAQQFAGDYAQSVGNQFVKPAVDAVKQDIAESSTAQQVSTIVSKQYLLTMWTKYKTFIIIGAVAIVGLIFRNKIFGSKTRRR